MVLLQTLDHLWREHLVTLEHLRQVIGFRAYGQRDPLNEYKSEAFVLFEAMLANLREAVTGQLMHVELASPEAQARHAAGRAAGNARPATSIRSPGSTSWRWPTRRSPPKVARLPVPEPDRRPPLQTRKSTTAVDPSDPATWGRVARNALCPCGSGKKYKHCHGKND